jgi:hypothetical protein
MRKASRGATGLPHLCACSPATYLFTYAKFSPRNNSWNIPAKALLLLYYMHLDALSQVVYNKQHIIIVSQNHGLATGELR